MPAAAALNSTSVVLKPAPTAPGVAAAAPLNSTSVVLKRGTSAPWGGAGRSLNSTSVVLKPAKGQVDALGASPSIAPAWC